jgi:integrase
MESNVAKVITLYEEVQEDTGHKRNSTKLKKDGITRKMTPCNSKENRDNVYPFKEEDIPKMVKYFMSRIESSNSQEEEVPNRRNLVYFITGINIGLRCSDLVSLKWSDVYDENWEFLDGKKIKPLKTQKKDKHVLLKFNDSFKRAVTEYKDFYNPQQIDGYIFKSREGGHIEVRTAGKIIKEAAKCAGITYNVILSLKSYMENLK